MHSINFLGSVLGYIDVQYFYWVEPRCNGPERRVVKHCSKITWVTVAKYNKDITVKSRPTVQRCLKKIGMESFARDSTIDTLEAILCVVIDIHTSLQS
jgi:ASC-1-like (ASCH) protein